MNNKSKKILLVPSLFLMLSACSNNFQSQISTKFKNSVQANANADSHIAWELSPDNSVKIFTSLCENYAQLDADKKPKYVTTVCDWLSELSSLNLSVFQDEMNKAINTEILGKDCQKSLAERINLSNSDQISKFEYKLNSTNLSYQKAIDFKLPTKTVELNQLVNTTEMIAQLKDGEVVLTFDDGPDGIVTDSILKTLRDAGNLKALFFTNGRNIVLNPDKIINEHNENHLVANHSWNHLCLKDSLLCANKNKTDSWNGILTDREVLDQEINPNFEIIKKYIGQFAPFFRFPFGETRSSIDQYFKDQGVFQMGWNIDTDDWKKVQNLGIKIKDSNGPTKIIVDNAQIPFTGQDVIDSAVRQLKLRKKGIVLFHDIHIRTAEILPQFLYELHKLKFTVVIFKPNLKKAELKTILDSSLNEENSF